ncbi:hypothetical protein STAFG_6508 [Streptomyces afghaniensis 772]|uniref:Uncharacterized protein n=1 Tax=Streptomyces afghaniensis 772 TaxID=1283301 RepID=S4MIV1_9ACTN|nr:hypothetical protein STAFG_6508 [Streptomyces afghaniensis 772]
MSAGHEFPSRANRTAQNQSSFPNVLGRQSTRQEVRRVGNRRTPLDALRLASPIMIAHMSSTYLNDVLCCVRERTREA